MLRDVFGKPLDIQTDLDGWSVVVPGGRIGLFQALILLPHLLMGAGMAVFGVAMLTSTLLNGSGDIGSFGGIFGIAMGILAVIGSAFAGNAGRRFVRAARSTRLEVSGNDLRIERRFLGRTAGAPERVALAALGPVSFSGPFWSSTLHLSPTLAVPAFVDQEHRETLKEVFADCIEQAHANPDQLPAPPEGLQRLLAARQGADAGHR